MDSARRFFFVCVGVLMLAVALHLGHTSAAAQIGPTVEGANIQSIPGVAYPRATGCIGRTFYWIGENGASHAVPVPVPGTRHILSTDPYETVLLENGDWLKFDGSAWVLVGNLVGGPIAATRTTWGELKTRYR